MFQSFFQCIYTLCLFGFVCVCVFLFCVARAIFSYLATVTITSDRAANLDLCLALTAFSSEGSFTYHTYCNTGPPIRETRDSHFWMPYIGEGAITTYSKRLTFDAAGPIRARTHDLPDAKREHYHEATQPVYTLCNCTLYAHVWIWCISVFGVSVSGYFMQLIGFLHFLLPRVENQS
jgi:hypothetical protein